MSPLGLKILLHYYSSPDDYEEIESDQAQIVIHCFIEAEMMTTPKRQSPKSYYLTEMGCYWVEHVLATPYPEMKFEITRKEEE